MLTSYSDDAAALAAIQVGAVGFVLKHVLARTPSPLIQRELSVLTLISQGMTNRQISTELAIRPSTVETHVSHIMTKLQVATRVEAVLYAIKHGLVTGPV